jgi:nucleoside-diphosphate-sugar epimerase
MENRDIVLKTAGLTCRSYLYTADAAAAILTVMLYGKDGEAYNAANEATYCSIRQMAELVAKECADGRIGVRIEAEEDPTKLGYAPTLHMNLDTSKLRALGWKPVYSLADTYRRMMAAMEKNE